MVFQIVANPFQLQIVLSLVEEGTILASNPLKVALTFASLWNLDFFRLHYSFCLHPRASAMDIMALDYATAVYPVFLIGITYVMVKCHDYHFKPLVWMWKPLDMILKPIRRQWKVRTSLVDVFASFLYLSSSRLLWVSMNFLLPNKVYSCLEKPDGSMKLTAKYYLYTASTVEYFGKEHIPFAILAIVLSLAFFALPMALLFLYPFSWFQRVLNRTGLNSLTLHTFMEVFQGPFKDGTNGTKDYRYFSGFFLLLPLALTLTLSQTLSSFFYPVASIWILVYLVLYLLFQPFKCQRHNYITIAMITALLGIYWGMVINMGVLGKPFNNQGILRIFWFVSIILMAISIPVPLLYLLGLVCVLIKWRCDQQRLGHFYGM